MATMSDRRSHWDDELVDAVGAEIDAEAQIQSVRDVIRDHRSIIGDPGVSAIQQALDGEQR